MIISKKKLNKMIIEAESKVRTEFWKAEDQRNIWNSIGKNQTDIRKMKNTIKALTERVEALEKGGKK